MPMHNTRHCTIALTQHLYVYQLRGRIMPAFGRRTHKEPVVLNVYDLNESNDYMYSWGLGTYHSGVVVHGTEYTFASGSGVFTHSPQEAGGAKFRESIVIGEVLMGSHDVDSIVNELKPDFPGDSYNLIMQNCNSFSSALVQKLLPGSDIPAWVNRMARMGQTCSCLLPKELLDSAPVNDGSSGSGGASSGGGGSALKAPPARTNYTAFSGAGNSLSGGGTTRTRYSRLATAEDEPDDRRSKMLRAAAARMGGSKDT